MSESNKQVNVHKNNIALLDILFCLTQILNFVGYITNAYEITNVYSLVSRLYIIINLVSFIIYLFFYRHNEKTFKLLLIFTLIIVSTLVSYAVKGGNIRLYDFLLILFAYLSLPMYVLYVNKVKVQKSTINVIILFAVLSGLFFIFSWIFHPVYNENDAITLGFFNPNQTGMFLFQNVCVLLIVAFMIKNSYFKAALFIIIILEAYISFLTQSRMSFLCVILCVVFFLFRNKIKFSKFSTGLFLFLPIIFVFILEILYQNNIFLDAEILGKPLFSGREEMYNYSLNSIRQNPLFGYFGYYMLGNAHNAYISILASVGFVGFLLFIAFYFNFLLSVFNKNFNNKIQWLAFSFLLLIFLESSVEVALLISGSMYSAATSPLILFLNYDEKNNKKAQL